MFMIFIFAINLAFRMGRYLFINFNLIGQLKVPERAGWVFQLFDGKCFVQLMLDRVNDW